MPGYMERNPLFNPRRQNPPRQHLIGGVIVAKVKYPVVIARSVPFRSGINFNASPDTCKFSYFFVLFCW